MFQSLTFWTLLAGLLAFVIKFFVPSFPLDDAQLLALIVSLLGLVNIYPQVRVHGLTAGDLLRSKPFWVLVSGLVGFVIRYFMPSFPLDDLTILALIVFVLGLFNVNPELRARGLR